MQAYLMGGPATGRVITHPESYLVRLPIPKRPSLTEMLDTFDPSVLPVIPVANYQFTGSATVNLKGDVQYMLYRYIGMDT